MHLYIPLESIIKDHRKRVLQGDKIINESREAQCVYCVYAQHYHERSLRCALNARTSESYQCAGFCAFRNYARLPGDGKRAYGQAWTEIEIRF